VSRGKRTLQEALDRIEEARRERKGPSHLEDGRITLSHGSGGKASQSLIEGVFGAALSNPILDERGDAAVFGLDGTEERLALTTDTFVVSPRFFPGGDIGQLAVHGTVNDLAAVGARPLHLSLAVVLEEGFEVEELQRIVASVKAAAEHAGAPVVTGDTKVVEKGHGDGIYINTTGLGRVRPCARLSPRNARPGDRILVSGPLGEHGVAVMIARRNLELEGEIASDTAPLNGLVDALLDACADQVRCLRDATRGGLAAALNEIAEASGVAITLEEERIPLRREIRGACEILGIDALHMANEGKMVAVVGPDGAEEALEAMRAHPLGAGARIVGEVVTEPPEMVFVRTGLGGRRVLDMLVGDALPRIC